MSFRFLLNYLGSILKKKQSIPITNGFIVSNNFSDLVPTILLKDSYPFCLILCASFDVLVQELGKIYFYQKHQWVLGLFLV